MFSQSHWEAIRYLGQETVVEQRRDGVDASLMFPPRVVRAVDYGVRFGLEVRVAEFVRAADGSKAGATMMLYSGNRHIGSYAVRY